MFDKFKEIARHSAIYGIGSVVQALVGFILIPLYTKHYEPETYGVLSLLTLSGTLAGALFFLGGSSALSRSYYDFPDAEERKKAVSASLLITGIGAGTQLILGFFASSTISRWLFGSPKYSLHVSVALAASAFLFTNNLLFLLLRFAKRSGQVVMINLISLLLGVSSISYFLLHMHLGVLAPVLGDLCNQFLLCALLLWLTRGDLNLEWPGTELSLQLRYGLPTMLAGLAYYTLTWADRLLLDRYASLTAVGIYSLGYKLGGSIQILLIGPFCQIWAPMRMQYRDSPDAPEFFKRALTYYFFVGLTIVSCFGMFSHEVLSLFASSPGYSGAGGVIALIMLAQLIYGSINIIDCGIVFSRRTHLHLYLFAACVPFNLALNYFLIGRFGAIGAAWASLATFLLLAGLVFPVSNRLYHINVEFNRLGRIFGLTFVTLLVSLSISGVGMLSSGMRACALLCTFWVTYHWVMKPGERQRFRQIVSAGGSRLGLFRTAILG